MASTDERNAAVDALKLLKTPTGFSFERATNAQLLVIGDAVLKAAEKVRAPAPADAGPTIPPNLLATAKALWQDPQARGEIEGIINRLGGITGLIGMAPSILHIWHTAVTAAATNPKSLHEMSAHMQH